ncbi:MAG TPA: hybrid sensor histidine kinase/response regulator [Pyrinomonadaceae bacterium]|jgi:CheY-like chemotaxis protein
MIKTDSLESSPVRAQADTVVEAERELARVRSGFVSTLIHDVRLPLASILALLELFDTKLSAREPFDVEDRELLLSAVAQGARLRRLVDDLLEVAQQQERPLALEPEQLDTNALLEELIAPVRGEAALRGVEVNLHVPAGTPPLAGDARQVRRALAHVLACALDATRDGGAVGIEAQGITGTRRGDEGRSFVIINFTDTSDGISAEELPYVFDSFWQPADGRRHAGGCGVRLAIAKRVAAAHGGNVAVRSQRGVGATYSILLPAHTERAEPAAQTRRVLIVEDTSDLRVLLGKLVERMGYEAVTADSAAHALALLEREPRIDLLLTDWAMPEVSGGELITKLKCDPRWRNLPSIVLTGHDSVVAEAAAAGCDRFLVKPVLRDELQETIAELLASKTA